jgi:poly-gamma-glutamate capsule biosynthesis protein CapA/YwtB (metallophosphatase superfamily)
MRRAASLALLILAALSFAVPTYSASYRQNSNDLTAPLQAANMCGAGLPGETHFTIAATGDTFPHENIQAVGEAQGYDTLFDYVRPFLKAADVAYTNFDGAMLAGAGYTGYPNFNYNPALATALKNAGINLVSTANNHILDRGPEGLDATMQVLVQNGIQFHGTVPSNMADQPHPPYLPLTLSRDGVNITVGFISATWGTNGIPDPYNQVNLLYASNSYGNQGGVRQSVLDAIAQAKRETDVVVVAAHWGYEYKFYPEASQIEAAQKMAKAGADVILGAQPHTLQPVDIIDTNGRKTLVIYSLANFLASQGAYQAESYSATSVIFYVGLVREPSGTVRVTGYRYLPTIHVDNDTRPAPIPPQGYEQVINHVRQEMRDSSGAKQLLHDPAVVGERVEICPSLTIGKENATRIGGDFAEFYKTVGSDTIRSSAEVLAILGQPLGPPVQELSGDCQTTTSVLYTERQRLELHPDANWPFRVVGTQIGLEVYKQTYKVPLVPRLDESAITNPAFRSFYQQYGGIAVFGLPISAELNEQANGDQHIVQYFERARFERSPNTEQSDSLINQVRLAPLTREYAGIAVQCNQPAAASTSTAILPLVSAGESTDQSNTTNPFAKPHQNNTAATTLARPPLPVDWFLLALGASLALGVSASWLSFRRTKPTRSASRVAARRATQRTVAPTTKPTPSSKSDSVGRSDDEILRDLLEL